MTLRAAKTAANTAVKPEADSAKKRPRWKVVVNNTGAEATAATEATVKTDDHISAERLALAARTAQRDLPYRRQLEEMFGQPLDRIVAVEGPEVEAALDAEHVDAATVDDRILLRRDAPLTTVAHEVVHMLQKRGTTPVDPAGTAAEDEAARIEHDVAEGRAVAEPTMGLPENAIAFRRSEDIAVEDELLVQPETQADADFQAAVAVQTAQDSDAAQPDGATEEAAGGGTVAGAAGESAFGEPELAADLEENPVPTFEPAPMPEIEVDEAAAEAAAAEAEAALSGADDADGMMTAFKDAPPSVKASHHDQLEANAGELAIAEQANFDSEMPVFEAQMSGADDLAAPEPVATPESAAMALEDGTPGPVPEAVVDPTPDAGQASLNDNIRSLLTQLFGFSDSSGLGQAFNRVKTDDNEVDTSAGELPVIPLEGEADPERVTNQDSAAREDATAKRQEATQGVLEGPGPETVTLASVQEEFPLEPRVVPEISGSEGPVEGAAGFRDKELDPEVVVLFDQFHQDEMAESMAEAEAETAAAVSTRDTERDTEVTAKEAERDRLNTEADAAQRDEVTTRRQEVQDARQTAVDAQAGHVADLETEADTARIEAEGEIDTQITDTDAAVETSFAEAETQAEAEVTQGEGEAEEERLRQEREAENSSWWDRATNWVADQFDKLTSFINDVFDAVRSAVKGLIDAVKSAAIALIDTAAKAITSAIAAFGEILKAGVNALLAEHFPAVAAALNNAIDGAVEVATNAVNAVAEGLKAGISALLDALAAAIDAILAVFQGAINAALAIAKAALTGDWAALAKLILEPVLRALGIEPQAFYDTIARALEALDIIIDDPIGFLSNLLDAVKGGIRRFADNLLTHLQAGIIAWLTGALGSGITIPTEWNLAAVLDLARQILGLTTDMLRRVAVRILGEAAVEKIEFFMGYVTTLITSGWSALWDKITEDLSNLKDLVLEQIKSFLTQRIVIAAITWLASLFNPVGALIKLVMTIWNLMMFLKDQFMRIIEVATTIIRMMYDIATGVLAPAIQAVEGVLARLLPIAIDLLARLLGLGNVAGRVQRIIADVRQKIEDAIVRLIERVLAAFRGGGSGGATEQQGTDSDTDLMRPIAFAGGGESHSLYIQEEGADAVPMMSSTPTPVTSWLTGLRGSGLDQIGAAKTPAWTDDQISNKRAEIELEVTNALTAEAQLNNAGDAANREEDSAPAGQVTTPDPALAAAGQQLATAMSTILEKLGLSSPPIEVTFSSQIAAMHPGLRADFERRILPLMTPATDYQALSWAQVTGRVVGLKLPVGWAKPAAARSILRLNSTLEAEYFAAVAILAEAEIGDRFDAGEDIAAMTDFLNNFLTQELNKSESVALLLSKTLSADGKKISDILKPVEAVITKAAKRYVAARVDGPDVELKDDIKGSTIFDRMRDFAAGGSKTYNVWKDNDPASTSTGTANLLEMISSGDKTERYTKNRTYVASTIRTAPGPVARPHEWVQAASADRVLQHAAAAIESGNKIALKAASELIEFQANVRTPTIKLIFDPKGEYPEILVTYKARPHRESAQYRDTDDSKDLPESLREEWYPEGGLKLGDRVGLLQAHSGGLYAFAKSGALGDKLVTQSTGSGPWHDALTAKVQNAADEMVSTGNATPLKYAILGHYKSTIWDGGNAPAGPGGRLFQSYYRSPNVGSAISYDSLKTEFTSGYRAVFGELANSINVVIGR